MRHTRTAARRAAGCGSDSAACVLQPARLSWTRARAEARLTDTDMLAGNLAAEALGRTGNRTVVPDLLGLLAADNVDVRARAATALGLLKVEAAVPQLGTMLVADGSPARNRAAEALAAIGTREALEALARPLAEADNAGTASCDERAGAQAHRQLMCWWPRWPANRRCGERRRDAWLDQG